MNFPKRKYPPELTDDRIIEGFIVALVLLVVFQIGLLLLFSALTYFYPRGLIESWANLILWNPGWSQLICLPFYIWRNLRRGKKRRASGAAIFVGIMFFLTTACNAMIWGNFGPL
jgi:hypothetical protein